MIEKVARGWLAAVMVAAVALPGRASGLGCAEKFEAVEKSERTRKLENSRRFGKAAVLVVATAGLVMVPLTGGTSILLVGLSASAAAGGVVLSAHSIEEFQSEYRGPDPKTQQELSTLELYRSAQSALETGRIDRDLELFIQAADRQDLNIPQALVRAMEDGDLCAGTDLVSSADLLAALRDIPGGTALLPQLN